MKEFSLFKRKREHNIVRKKERKNQKEGKRIKERMREWEKQRGTEWEREWAESETSICFCLNDFWICFPNDVLTQYILH